MTNTDRRRDPELTRKVFRLSLVVQGGVLLWVLVDFWLFALETWRLYPHARIWLASWQMANNPDLIRPSDDIGELHAALMVSSVIDRASLGLVLGLALSVFLMMHRLKQQATEAERKLAELGNLPPQ